MNKIFTKYILIYKNINIYLYLNESFNLVFNTIRVINSTVIILKVKVSEFKLIRKINRWKLGKIKYIFNLIFNSLWTKDKGNQGIKFLNTKARNRIKLI